MKIWKQPKYLPRRKYCKLIKININIKNINTCIDTVYWYKHQYIDTHILIFIWSIEIEQDPVEPSGVQKPFHIPHSFFFFNYLF